MRKLQSLPEQLLGFGLDMLEARMYLHLLHKKPQTIVEISRDTNIPRATVYDAVLRIMKKGLVEKIIDYKSQKFQAYPLSILQTIIDSEKSRLEKLQENLVYLEKTISKSLSSQTATNVRYYHGKQGMMQMLWNTLQADKETIGYSESGRIDIVGKKFKFRWFEETIRRGIKDRVIINPGKETLIHHFAPPEDTYVKQFQTIRHLGKKELYISGDTTIYNNIFAVCYWKQGEIVGVEIENPELVKNQRSIFENLWKIAKPISGMKEE